MDAHAAGKLQPTTPWLYTYDSKIQRALTLPGFQVQPHQHTSAHKEVQPASSVTSEHC